MFLTLYDMHEVPYVINSEDISSVHQDGISCSFTPYSAVRIQFMNGEHIDIDMKDFKDACAIVEEVSLFVTSSLIKVVQNVCYEILC